MLGQRKDSSGKEVIHIGPQPGPQELFLSSVSDIALYGGAAGGGKSYALLLEPLRHFRNAAFGGVIFRRNSTQVRVEGGLWDESKKLYGPLGARPREAQLEWLFPKSIRMKFAHLEHERSVYDWQGSQIPYIGFDELTHFTENQFFYMLSRNRSTSGVPGYMRATCNPDADSWVRRLVDWWIDTDGYPIPERSGKIRWFIRYEDQLVWSDSREELVKRHGEGTQPKSFTFIPADIHDNKILMDKDPTYLASLKALNKVERLRLLGGNWNVRATAGSMFRREWFPVIDAIPAGWIAAIRYWDRAATKPNPANPDPDWTRGLKLYKYPEGRYVVADLRSMRNTPGNVETFIRNVAQHDSVRVRVMSQCDPGSAGKSEAEHFIKLLAGFAVEVETLTKNKVARAKPVSAQCEAGNILVVRAPWNEPSNGIYGADQGFFGELENFPDGSHDDIVDVLSGAFNKLSGGGASILDRL